MLLATLALLHPTQIHVGAGYSVEVPEDRLVVEEFTNDGAYVFSVLDPQDRGAVVPPLRVLYAVEGRQVPHDPNGWAQSAVEDARRMFEAKGWEVRDGETSTWPFQGGHTTFYELEVTDDAGEDWLCTFGARHIEDAAFAALYSWAHPTDRESQRSKDVWRALSTLTRQRWDPLKPLPLRAFGVSVGVPAGWDNGVKVSGPKAFGGASSDTCEIELRWYQVGEGQAHASAEQFLKDLPAQLKEIASPTGTGDYLVPDSTRPAMFGVGDRVVRGYKSKMYTGHPREGWRWDAVIPIGELVLVVTVTARDDEDDEGLQRMQAVLETIEGAPIHGRTVTTIRDGLILEYDANVELLRGGPDYRRCYQLKRRGIDDADRTVGVHELQTPGEVFLEFRADLEMGKRSDYVTAEFREKIYEHRKVTGSSWVDGLLLGKPVRGVEARYYSKYRNEKVRDHVTVTFAEEWKFDQYLLAGFRGPKHTRAELETLLRHLMRGVTDARELDTVLYQDVGVRYAVDPNVWIVEGGADGTSSVATLRSTTLKTAWTPKAAGGLGLLGSGLALDAALREKVEAAVLGWSGEGATSEPLYGDAAFGANAEVPAKFATLRRSDADGKEWDEIWMVAESATGRVWVHVTNDVSDTEAAAAVTEVLATVLPR